MSEQFFVYIMANKPRGDLYVGITNDLVRRTYEHRTSADPNSHTSRYKIKRLVYYEVHQNPTEAIRREKRLKDWDRDWKLVLVEGMNPKWDDLWSSIAKP